MKKTKVKAKKLKVKSGRPSKFPEIVKLLPGIKVALQMGHSQKDTCEMFNIPISTFEKYKSEKPQFMEELRKALLLKDEQVGNSLFKRAIGYKFTERHYEGTDAKTKKPKLKKKIVKEVAPDVHAQIFYLKNRMPKVWKDKQEMDLSNTDGSLTPDNITINIVPTRPKNAPQQ